MTDAIIAERRDDRPRGRARPQGRRQALDRRRGGQDLDRRRADRRGLRRPVREDERPRARAHRRDARQARVDPGLPSRADPGRVRRTGARRRRGDHRPDRRSRAGRQAALCAPRRHRHGGFDPADRGEHHVQEDRRRGAGDRPRRQGRRRRLHADAARGAGARRGHARARDACGPRGRLPAHGHGPAARERGRQRARDPRGDRHDPRARGHPTSPSSCSPPRRGSSPSPTSGSTRKLRGSASKPRSPTARPRRPTGAGSRRRAAIPTRIGSRPPRSSARSRPTRDGGVAQLRALPAGIAALELGAGRRSKGDEIDHAVGVVLLKKRGDSVSQGEPSPRSTPATSASARRGRRRGCGLRSSWASSRPSRQASSST